MMRENALRNEDFYLNNEEVDKAMEVSRKK